jgi:hypothetical protein
MRNRSIEVMCVAVLLALSGLGCSHSFTGLASHTVPTGEIDVVWVVRDTNRIFRCVETSTGPRCDEAQVVTR